MRIVFAGGGTGGHIYPALAVADEMKSRFDSFNPLFVGTRAGLESEIIEEFGYSLRFIVSGPMRGRKFWRRIGTLSGMAAGMIQSIIIISRFKPDLVIGFGGYASVSVVVAASVLGKAIVLQEQNSIPGLTNRMLSRFAERIYLGFNHAARFFSDREKLLHTGNPLRSVITEEYEGDAAAAFGLAGDLPVLLAFGGSQGASSLNRAALEYIRSTGGVQMIIQTGKRDYRMMKSELSGFGDRVFVTDYIKNIREAYEAADIVISRAGALSVSEIASVGIPAILVPYPFSADNHQVENARYLEEAGGAVMVEDSELSGERLGAILDNILSDRQRIGSMAEAARSRGINEAARKIVDDIESILERKSG
ncbi:MAG: undecaprenyldiphospho-muramoylpentapeptide beta-N-acetylglucosaminyltransferase [Candidatus Krumholzibacteriales bacterium]